ncbi:hypothetical protein L7F22_050064 [Adiantum nelumboides]|nr:hypothetical protein [Adiantum nelumboides]
MGALVVATVASPIKKAEVAAWAQLEVPWVRWQQQQLPCPSQAKALAARAQLEAACVDQRLAAEAQLEAGARAIKELKQSRRPSQVYGQPSSNQRREKAIDAVDRCCRGSGHCRRDNNNIHGRACGCLHQQGRKPSTHVAAAQRRAEPSRLVIPPSLASYNPLLMLLIPPNRASLKSPWDRGVIAHSV